MAAASSKVIPSGLWAIGALSRTHTYSACVPNLHGFNPKTRSPVLNSVTATPASATSPASSVPRTRRFGRRSPVTNRAAKGVPPRSPVSVLLTVVAWTLTRTSSSLGTGCATSSRRSTSGGPYPSWTTALMRHHHLIRRASQPIVRLHEAGRRRQLAEQCYGAGDETRTRDIQLGRNALRFVFGSARWRH